MKEDIYRHLARRYKWSFVIIAKMTLYQQCVACSGENENFAAGTLSFETEQEYNEWAANL